jgi:hypothetical protein
MTYDVEAFRCPECGLALDGREEVSIAGLPAVFHVEEERAVEYEEEYGNE